MKYKSKKGFTLAELLIVVAIIAVLVAISIPIFTGQLEKARRAVDMQNARAIESALVLAYNTGEIEVPKKSGGQHGYGVWVMLCNKTAEYAPKPYHDKSVKGMWCGANQGVTVGNNTATDDWTYNKSVENILKEAGMDVVALRTRSNGGADGWDWVIIEVGYDTSGQFFTRIYSGYKNENGSAGTTGYSNIEKQIYGKSS
nr:prepilin-type N-terminal cleavage/methylation domain-containing protein [uncultured Blautia sp.]